MRRYTNPSALTSEHLTEIFKYLFDICDKVNIYFPHTASLEVLTFKNKFLEATHITLNDDERSSLEESLEEKEGYSMIIASLTNGVKELILSMPLSLHLNLGLIHGDKVLFYRDAEGECVIEDVEDSNIFSSSLFDIFTRI